MKIVPGGVTTALGFTAAGIAAGIKRSGKPDLALIACEIPAVSACVITKNSIKAAPIVVCQKKMRRQRAQAILVNSGNANCFTGQFGLLYAQKSTELIGRLLAIADEDVLVASTGIIGKPLPYNKIERAAPGLVQKLSRKGGHLAARAILTTDKWTKEIAVTTTIGGKKITVGGCAKGSGMIQPNMATMLAFITTDAAINPKLLDAALRRAVDASFNCITVDGCMSTNDMVSVMASGFAGNHPITAPGKDFDKFCEALDLVCLDLAKKIVLDAEGGTKFITVTVKGGRSFAQAKAAAMAVANSMLVKCAAFGSDANWGRVAAAVGSLGLNVTEKNLKIDFSSFKKKDIDIIVDLNSGKETAKVYTSDLSFEYVRINGRYN